MGFAFAGILEDRYVLYPLPFLWFSLCPLVTIYHVTEVCTPSPSSHPLSAPISPPLPRVSGYFLLLKCIILGEYNKY